jgi:hypothetical protein
MCQRTATHNVFSTQLQLLQFMNWNVTTVTPTSFVDMYIAASMEEERAAHDKAGRAQVDVTETLRDHAMWFLESALYEVSTLAFLPSIRAVSPRLLPLAANPNVGFFCTCFRSLTQCLPILRHLLSHCLVQC